MSITIETYPPLVALAKNPVVYELQSDNVVITNGVYGIFKLVFLSGLADGDSFDLIWGSNTVTITAKTTPDTSGNQIKAIGAESIYTWVAQTLGYLNTNYAISRDFSLSSTSPDNIQFEARESGTLYDMTVDNEPGAKMTSETVVDAEDEELQDFFSILCQTFVKSGALMLQKFEDALSVDTSSNAITDVSEILKAELYSEFEWPEAAANSFKKREHILLPYFLRYCEQYGNPLVQQALKTTQYMWALNGGVPFWKQVEYYSAGTSFWDRMQYDMNFLTWQPKTKKIDINQSEKLYFLAWKKTLNATLCRLKITAHPIGSSPVEIYSGDQAMTYMDVFEIEVGYQRLNTLYNLGAYFAVGQIAIEAGSYYEVEVVIKAGGLAISEKFTYEFDLNEYPNIRYFMFLNSLGGYDTVRCTGIGEFELGIERTVITSPYPKEFDVAFRMKKNTFIEGSQKMKVNTGWKTKEDIDWLQEMMLSEEVYEIIGSNMYPVLITSSSAPKYVDEQSPAYFMEIEYERSAHETTYTPGTEEPGEGAFSDGFSDGFLN